MKRFPARTCTYSETARKSLGNLHLIVVLHMGAALLALSNPQSAHARETLSTPQGKVILTVSGKIGRTNDSEQAHFDREMLERIGSKRLETSTPWTKGVQSFEGISMRDLLDAVGADGESVAAIALNDYMIDIPLSDFDRYEVLLALKMNGEYMRVRDKGPIWIVYPYDQHDEVNEPGMRERAVWQLRELIVK